MSSEREDSGSPYLLDLPTFEDERGRLTVAEVGEAVPFGLERVYYLYDVPAAATRGEHAHRNLEQVMIAVSGALDVTLEGRFGREEFRLDSPDRGLYVPRMAWRELANFTDGAVCLVLASRRHDPDDYVEDRDAFLDRIGRS